MIKDRVKMSEQPVKKRIKNFNEVPLGLNETQAVEEAKRCLGCKKPKCIKGCPVEVDIPGFIKLIKEKRFLEAAILIKEKNALPAICGRVCPQETQCEKECVLGKKSEPIAIGYLERFVADWERSGVSGVATWSSDPQQVAITGVNRRLPPTLVALRRARKSATSKKVAVVGSGPAGLTVAADLVKLGYKVTIFEALHKAGGVLMYGIPEFRLPKEIVQTEARYVESLGVEIRTNTLIGKLFTIEELRENYDAIFIGIGAGTPKFMNIEGENLNGVYSANEFLTRVNLMKAYLFPEYDTPIKIAQKVAVVGGGNVAMDSARTALRLGAKIVYLIYRRSELEMPARIEEVKRAKEEGIEFRILTNPVRIIGDKNGWVKEIECVEMKLGEPDASGRARPIAIEGSEFKISVDQVIMALGTDANPLLTKATKGLKLNKWGYIEVDENGQTSLEGVYAGGDIVTGSATVISAMGAARRAGRAIDKYLKRLF